VAIKRFLEIAISSPEIGGPLSPHSRVLLNAPHGPTGSIQRRAYMVKELLPPSLIFATDTAFSSNRFAWTHQVHKLDLQVRTERIRHEPIALEHGCSSG
jgi:hypothetical protein